MTKDSKGLVNPLCTFCLSPPFSIRIFTRPVERSTSRRLSVHNWRRGGSSLYLLRSRFKPFNKRSNNLLAKYLAGFFSNRKKGLLTVAEILQEIRKAWKSPRLPRKSHCIVTPMEDRWSKCSTSNYNETVSPILLRRRLSAPETIMRKHMLTQQRCNSLERESVQLPEQQMQYWKKELEVGSDSNLTRRRDLDHIRKNTLRRSIWNHRLSGIFSNIKLNSGRSSQSLGSIQSSPEKVIKYQQQEDKRNEQTRKCSPKHVLLSENKTRVSSTSNTSKTTTEADSNPAYTSYTTFSDNSDSAYTESRSNYSRSSNNNSAISNNNSHTSSEICKQIVYDFENLNQDSKNFANLNNKNSKFLEYYDNRDKLGTEIAGSTNVNVISNIHLSQATLNLIYNQVIQDVKTIHPNINNNNAKASTNSKNNNHTQPTSIKPKNNQSFYLKQDYSKENSKHHLVKNLLSEVCVGSSYAEPIKSTQITIPRMSARPFTSSMEVNISSGESTDRESDSASLVDSLEDTSSFQTDPTREKLFSKSEESLELPDNSIRKTSAVKPTAFFIPIQVDAHSDFTPVSEHLPDKVKNKLIKRQKKREEKVQNRRQEGFSRPDSNYASANENDKHFHFIVNSSADVNLNSVPFPETSYRRAKKPNKPLLPSIESLRKNKFDEQKTKHIKRKFINNNTSAEKVYNKSKHTFWIPKLKNEKLSPLYKTKNEYVYDYGPRRIYHKTEFNSHNSRRIEILEIMECVESSEKITKLSKTKFKSKSKIPVLISQKMPTIQKQSTLEKPTFLDLKNPINDPKLDQLIANLLIETLNVPTQTSSPVLTKTKEVQLSPKYNHKFDAIPEELPLQSSTENDQEKSYQGKEAVAVVKEDNFSSIPKGWITFYMLRNNQESPDSTSDEGKVKDSGTKIGGTRKNLPSCKSYENDSLNNIISYEDSNADTQANTISLISPTRCKQDNHTKLDINSDAKLKFGEWSVTVSGTNKSGQFPSDLEMSLKFPDLTKNFSNPSHSDSGLGEDSEQKLISSNTISEYDEKYHAEKENKFPERSTQDSILPDIHNPKLLQKHRRCETSTSCATNLMSSAIEPRQTRTSTRRYYLNRPKIEYQKLETTRKSCNMCNDRHYIEILKRFPEILSITGSGINQERK